MISIIIPAYNSARTIEKCLASIFAQTFRDFEVIVVDDGSTDATNDKLQMANDKFGSRIKIITQENRGAQAARNRGWDEVQKHTAIAPTPPNLPSGPGRGSLRDRGGNDSISPPLGGGVRGGPHYVLFCDADIALRPDCLEKMLHALEANPDAAYAYSSFKFGWKKFKLWPFDAVRLRKMPYIHTTSLIHAEHFPKTGWDEKVKRLQDWDLWLTMLEDWHTGVWVPEVLFTVINTKGTMSRWIPSFLHIWPLKRLTLQVKPFIRYNEAVAAIKAKHRL